MNPLSNKEKSLSVDREQQFKAYTVILGVIVAIIAFFAFRYEPTSGMDLAQYYTQVESGNVDHYGIDVYGDVQNADLVITFVMKNLVKYGFSSHVLGFLSAVLYFGLTSKISLLWTRFRAIRTSPLVLFFIFIFSGYFLAFTGIRSGNACLILILSLIYFELGRVRVSVSLSLLAFCMHFSLLPVIAIFWGAVLLPRWFVCVGALLLICLTPWMLVIMQKAQSLFFAVGGVFAPIAQKMDVYIFESYGVLPTVVRFLISGDTNVVIGAFWAGSRWWVGIGLVSCVVLGLLVFSLRREQKVIFQKLPSEKFFPLLLAYMIFTIEAPAIPMRTMMIVRFLVILTLLPMVHYPKAFLSRFYFFSIALLALLATLSGQEVVSFVLGGN